MKKPLGFLFVLLTISFSFASAETFTLPGTTTVGSYNNIGILGEVMLNLNVTLVNLAPYPKFIVVNPRYDFHVYRLGGIEFNVNNRTSTGEIVGQVSSYTVLHSLNYYIGFWIMPYETVVVNFQITSNASYSVPLRDYQDICGGIGHITSVTYSNGTVSSVNVPIPASQINRLTCGVVYPQLLNYPMIMSLRTLFPFIDRYIKVLKYDGTVAFRLTNVPSHYSSEKPFAVLFAVSVPVIFQGAKMFDYSPNYTMTYSQYVSQFIWKVRGLTPPSRKVPTEKPNAGSELFKLTNTLLSGVKVGQPALKPREHPQMNFPVWIIFMSDQINITYRVSWTNSGR
ncbi:hypothetical protein [Thermococcus sp.]|uniref:hypothetical protein n=1 Tax=Thermococcus sp. TaxID=35749 RepID=UPI0026212433|nr:hypothetical protein [Thermococcus sp.]